MDELEYLLGAGSLYDPKKDPRYADITGPQKDFDFAADFNKGFAEYYQRENNAAIRENNAAIAEKNQMIVQEEKRKREAMSDPDVIQGLANARTEDEVAEIMKGAAVKSGDYETLQKLAETRAIQKANDPRRRTETIKSIAAIAEMDPDLAKEMYREAFGKDPSEGAFKKKPKVQNVGGELVTIDEDTFEVNSIYKPKKDGPPKAPEYDTWYNKDGEENYFPKGELPPQGSGLKKTKPEKSLERIKAEAAARIQGADSADSYASDDVAEAYNIFGKNKAPEKPVLRYRRKSPTVSIGQK